MESKEQYQDSDETPKEFINRVQELYNKLLGSMLQPGNTQTPQIPSPTPVLQAGYSGFDPNDLQPCCNPGKIIILTPDNKEHDWKCLVAEKFYNKKYASNFPSELPSGDCDHEYVSYEGLKEKFDYCRKCDAKRT